MVGVRLTFIFLMCALSGLLFQACKTQSISTEEWKIIDEVAALSDSFDVKLESNGLFINFPKDVVIASFSRAIETLKSMEATSIERVEFNERMINRHSTMMKLVKSHSQYEIINLETSERLRGLNAFEQYELIEEDAEIGFQVHFKDFMCELAESGQLSVVENGLFVDAILKKRHFVKTEDWGKFSIVFTTKSGKEICECSVTNYQYQ